MSSDLVKAVRARLESMQQAWDDDVTNNHHFYDGESIAPLHDLLLRVVEAVDNHCTWSEGSQAYVGLTPMAQAMTALREAVKGE